MHRFSIDIVWTGNAGSGTSAYTAYRRDHEYRGVGKTAPIPGSSSPEFRGDAARYNPEELLVGALASCHMLWMLHLCADAGIVIAEYTDSATGEMRLNPDGSGEFTRVVLRPRLVIADAARAVDAMALHKRAHELCFIARSVNFPVEHEATVEIVRAAESPS